MKIMKLFQYYNYKCIFNILKLLTLFYEILHFIFNYLTQFFKLPISAFFLINYGPSKAKTGLSKNFYLFYLSFLFHLECNFLFFSY